MTMPELHRQEEVYVLDLGDDENRFTLDWLTSVSDLLDEVSNQPAPRALVTTARGKFYSNGLDLDWVLAHPNQVGAYVADVQTLLARVLALPMPTVAAVTGHAFGAGAMLATAHDWRVMQADRGYHCFPEVDIRIPVHPWDGRAHPGQADAGGRGNGDDDRPSVRRTGRPCCRAGRSRRARPRSADQGHRASAAPGQQGPRHPRRDQGDDVRRGDHCPTAGLRCRHAVMQ
jgi:Enoyl-CoA hydratase/isomerase